MGDSITQGGYGDVAISYPRILQNNLNTIGGIWDVINAGVSGNTTAMMLARFNTDVVAQNPSYVLIMGGVNDSCSAATTLSNIESMCALAVSSGIQPILVLMTPCGTVAEGTINSGLTSYGAAMNYPVIDFYSPLNDPTNPGNLQTIYVDHGIHPNQIGLNVLVNSINITNGSIFTMPPHLEYAEYGVPFTWCGMEWVVHTQQISGTYIDTTTNYLHMILQLVDGSWPSIDLISRYPIHPGSFQVTAVTDLSAIILGTAPGFAGGMPDFAFAMYVCDENVQPYRGEISIEPCQWGLWGAPTMSWLHNNVVPPNTGSASIRVNVNGPNVTHTLTWNPLYVKWEADGGTTGHLERTYYNDALLTSPVDTDGMHVRLMLSNALNGGNFPHGMTQIEVVLSDFVYNPLVPTWPDITTIPPLTNPLVSKSGSDLAFVVTLLDSNQKGINLTAVSEIFWCVFDNGGVILEKCYTNTPATDTITILNPEAGTIVVTLTADETSPLLLGSTTATNSYHHEGRLVFADGTQKIPSNLDGTLRITPTSTWGVSPPDSATPPVSKPLRGVKKGAPKAPKFDREKWRRDHGH